jgi:hypothetical protein
MNFIGVAQNRGPLDQMKDETKPGPKVSSQPEQWDLFTLISIFHDHFDTVFSKLSFCDHNSVNDFS